MNKITDVIKRDGLSMKNYNDTFRNIVINIKQFVESQGYKYEDVENFYTTQDGEFVIIIKDKVRCGYQNN